MHFNIALFSQWLIKNVHPSPDTEVEKAQALTEAYWEWHLREFPEFGTEIGISDHDDKVTEHTEESFERRAVS